MRRTRAAAWLLIAVFAGACVAAHAQEKKDDSSSGSGGGGGEQKSEEKCRTALDLIASQNMNLPLHPVFQNILNSRDLKGTIFIPTTKAWDRFFATMRQRQGNPAAPAMVARYGQVLLYHLAKDVDVPIAEATPGANKFAVDTASTLQCTFGTGLPNNRLIIRKTPRAILIQHGTGNATIMSQRIPYCGGEAYLVDEVLNPCGDISAIMGEIANIPSPCRNNVEGVLHRQGLSYFNALLLATGVQRPVFASVRDFTLFAPNDKAVMAAYRSGALNYPYLFARNKTTLDGIVAYHAVPQAQHVGPSKQTLNMKTLLTEGTGEARCANPTLSWRADGFVYGGTGNAKVTGEGDRGCNTRVFPISEVLQPCCKSMSRTLGGADGLAAKAPKGSIQEKAYSFLASKVEGGAAGTTFIMPSAEAWEQFEKDAKRQRVNLTDSKLDALFSYLLTRAPVSSQALQQGAVVPMNLAAKDQRKALQALCPKSKTKATLVFAVDQEAQAAAQAQAAAAAQAARARAQASGPFAGAALPQALGGSDDTLGAAPALPAGRTSGVGRWRQNGGGGAAAQEQDSSTLGGGGAGAGDSTLGAGGAGSASMGDAPVQRAQQSVPGLGPLRLLLQAATGGRSRTAAAVAAAAAAAKEDPSESSEGDDPSAGTGLLLPTTYTARAETVNPGTGIAAAGPLVLVDGQEMELQAGVAIPVTSTTLSCDGAIFYTDAVPLPCNLLNRTVVAPPPPPPVNFTKVLPAVAAANASKIANETDAATAAAAATTTQRSGALASLLPLGSSMLAAVLLGLLLL